MRGGEDVGDCTSCKPSAFHTEWRFHAKLWAWTKILSLILKSKMKYCQMYCDPRRLLEDQQAGQTYEWLILKLCLHLPLSAQRDPITGGQFRVCRVTCLAWHFSMHVSCGRCIRINTFQFAQSTKYTQSTLLITYFSNFSSKSTHKETDYMLVMSDMFTISEMLLQRFCEIVISQSSQS